MLLELKGIQKTIRRSARLSPTGISLSTAGEVHLLLGENGAGKSTLMKIVAGMHERDAGRCFGTAVKSFSNTPHEAARDRDRHGASGIAARAAPDRGGEHLPRPRDPAPLGWVNRRRAWSHRARRLIEEHHFPLQAEWRVEQLSPAGKQMVEICRAIQHGSSLLIFDEPTSSLSEAETQEVFRIVRTLRERSMGVIYITHRLEELRAVGDRVTILRDGRTVHSGPLAELTTDRIIQHMVGREVVCHLPARARPAGRRTAARRASDREGQAQRCQLSHPRRRNRRLAGLIGAGRTELCHAIFGVDALDSGTIAGRRAPGAIRSPQEAVSARASRW